MTPNRDTTDRSVSRKTSSGSNPSGYVYESDTVRRAHPAAPQRQQSQPSVRAKDIPYHAREDSKPFTYGMMVTNGHHHAENGSGGASAGNASPSIHRRNWKESSSTHNGQGQQSKRLESPSLVRKFSNGAEPLATSPSRSAPRIPVPSIDPASPRPLRKLSESLLLNGSGGAIGSPDNASGGTGTILPVATSSPRLDTSRNRSDPSEMIAKSPIPGPSQQQYHHILLEETIQDISTSPDSSRYEKAFESEKVVAVSDWIVLRYLEGIGEVD